MISYSRMKTTLKYWPLDFFRSFSQIMLQRNALTGFLFCLGIGLNSVTMLAGGIVATLSSLVVARLFHYEPEAINSGLYGFNAALVGVAIFCFYPPTALSISLLVIGGMLSTFVMHFMRVKMLAIPALTAPFIVSTWLIFLLLEVVGTQVSAPAISTYAVGDFYAVMRGVGQVIFQDYWLAGAIFVCGLIFNSLYSATWAVVGSALGLLVARTFNFSEELVFVGLYGFNACLAAIFLAHRYKNKLWLVFVGILLSVFITRIFEFTALPALTAPFVLASWFVIGVVRISKDYRDSIINKKESL